MASRNLSQSLMQVIFSIFLGIVVAAFVGIGVNTFYPEPEPDHGMTDGSAWQSHRLTTGIALLICATIVMALSLLRSEELPVLSNGVMFGGLFTMVYAVGVAAGAGNQWPRFLVITLALGVSVGLGYWKFVRHRPLGSTAGGAADVGEVGMRLDAIEAKLDALGRALKD